MEKSITIPSSHIIIFWDNSKKFITQFENNSLENMMASGVEIFELRGGGKYKFKDIKKWLPIAEYYELYPKEKSVAFPKIPFYKQFEYSKDRHILRLKKGIDIFKKNFNNRQMPPQAQKLLNHMEEKLAKAQGAPFVKKQN